MPRRPRRLVAGFTAATILLLSIVLVGPASAHTGFESSSPGDQSSSAEPVGEILVTFSGEAEPSGEGFVVLDPAGVVRRPDSITSVDNLTWVLGFDEPLVGGAVGVRWSVQAPDAHPIDGSFSFVVTAPAEPTTTTSTPTTAPSSSVGAAESGGPDTTVEVEPPAGLALEVEEPTDLGEFLVTEVSSATGSGLVGVIGRTSGLAGAMVGIGGLIFATMVLRGDRRDIRTVMFWVRRAGALLALGTLAEFLAQVAQVGGGWSSIVSPATILDVSEGSFGIAMALRFMGGFALAAGARIVFNDAVNAADPVVAIKELVGANIRTSTPTGPSGRHETNIFGEGEPYLYHGDEVWHYKSGVEAFVGIGLILGAFLFDGHTVTEGSRLFHAVVNVVHVATAAVWAGGLLMLAQVVWRRHARGDHGRIFQLAIRFSVVAAGSLVVAGIAGTVLTFVILDSVSELWATPWGRLLLAKMALVATAAAAGGYNHKVLIPEMESSGNDRLTTDRFRHVVTIEGVALAAVIVVTAFLVGAAS